MGPTGIIYGTMRQMRRLTFAVAVLALPILAAALDYSDFSERYTDVSSFSTAERAGISLLTSIRAVEGNPDGTFQPNRTLNRAEFLKIVLASNPQLLVSASDADNCFPDVFADAWYSRYVCLAQRRGIVSGYPDGTFKPAQPVNYAEALKMLGELYGWMIGCDKENALEGCVDTFDYRDRYPEPWYAAYAQLAGDRGVSLPANPGFDHLLTRSEMARLAAAYRAESEGELDLYRNAEAGEMITSSSSATSSVSSAGSSVSSTASSASSAISSSVSSEAKFKKATSHLLLIGTTPLVSVADATFTTTLPEAVISDARVELRRDISSLEALRVVDAAGNLVGVLTEDTSEAYGEYVWEGTFTGDARYPVPERTPFTLFIQAVLKDYQEGGYAGEVLEIENFRITAVNSNDAQPIIGFDLNAPSHTTVTADLHTIRNAGDTSGALAPGNDRLLAAFSFSGTKLGSSSLAVQHLLFEYELSNGVALQNLAVVQRGKTTRVPCIAAAKIECFGLPAEIGTLAPGEIILELRGDVQVPSPSGQVVQFFLRDAGAADRPGAVRWSDGGNSYSWLDKPSPLASGTRWTITP